MTTTAVCNECECELTVPSSQRTAPRDPGTQVYVAPGNDIFKIAALPCPNRRGAGCTGEMFWTADAGTDTQLQEATARGKAVTGGLPKTFNVEHMRRVLALTQLRFTGENRHSRVKVYPTLSKDGNPFFVIATDNDVEELRGVVTTALREIVEIEEKASEPQEEGT